MNFVLQRGLSDLESSIVVQYLSFGSIHPTANHWCFSSEDPNPDPTRSCRADIKLISINILPIGLDLV